MNNTLYDQLIELTRIPDAKSKWKDYREEITRLIIEECHGESLLVVGAGECNDIDIEKLAKHFFKITLFDRRYAEHNLIDERNEEVAKQDNVTIVSGDLLGISEDSYRKLCDRCQEYIAFNMNSFSMEAFADMYMSLIDKMYAEASPARNIKQGEFDNVVCIGVHSQINNMLAWIWDAYESALGQRDARVHSYIREKNDSIMKSVNDYLFSIADKKIIIGAEQKRVGMSGAIEGAHQCILDVQRRIQSYSYIDVNVTVIDWPFDVDRDIVYQMLISSISF